MPTDRRGLTTQGVFTPPLSLSLSLSGRLTPPCPTDLPRSLLVSRQGLESAEDAAKARAVRPGPICERRRRNRETLPLPREREMILADVCGSLASPALSTPVGTRCGKSASAAARAVVAPRAGLVSSSGSFSLVLSSLYFHSQRARASLALGSDEDALAVSESSARRDERNSLLLLFRSGTAQLDRFQPAQDQREPACVFTPRVSSLFNLFHTRTNTHTHTHTQAYQRGLMMSPIGGIAATVGVGIMVAVAAASRIRSYPSLRRCACRILSSQTRKWLISK